MERIKTPNYSYIPTTPPSGMKPGAKFAYESKLERGKEYAIGQIKKAIDRLKPWGFQTQSLSEAVEKIEPFIFVGDLDNGDSEPIIWHQKASKKLAEKFNVGGTKLAPQERRKFGDISNLVNQATAFHDVADQLGDDKINAILLPAVDAFIDAL